MIVIVFPWRQTVYRERYSTADPFHGLIGWEEAIVNAVAVHAARKLSIKRLPDPTRLRILPTHSQRWCAFHVRHLNRVKIAQIIKRLLIKILLMFMGNLNIRRKRKWCLYSQTFDEWNDILLKRGKIPINFRNTKIYLWYASLLSLDRCLVRFFVLLRWMLLLL